MLPIFIALIVLTQSQIDYTNQGGWTGSCTIGSSQSPINIPCSPYINACPASKTYHIYWANPTLAFGNSSFPDLKTFYTKQSWIKFSNQTNDYVYKSAQLHFHAPSEHTINGVRYDLEMHLVHINDLGTEYAVVSVLFQVDNTTTYDIIDQVDFASHQAFKALFPFALTNKAAYHYRGSLTTPPCTEFVNWFVQATPFKISPKNYNYIISNINSGNFNNRQTQRLNDREVYLIGQGCP